MNRFVIALILLLTGVLALSQAKDSFAVDPVAITVDANTSVAGVQATKSLVAEPTFTVDILVASISDLQALNFEVVYDQTKLSAPTISTGPDVDRNPDAKQSLLTSTGRSWACSPPAPTGDINSSPSIGTARLSCYSTGVPAGPGVGTTPAVLATLTFDAIAEGTSLLTLQNVNTFQALGVETGSCAPVVVKAATCTGASITVPADIDGDLVNNADEAACGSDPRDIIPPLSRPERIDGIFAGVDDDGDTQVDEALPPGAANFDCDGDGYRGSVEAGTPLCGDGRNEDDADDGMVDDGCPGGPAQVGNYSEAEFNIGAADQDPCGLTSWPSDFVSGGIPNSTNKITVTDLTSFLAPTRRLDTSPGNPNFSARWDLVSGRGLFANWVAVNDLTTLLAGPGGFPPMLGGAKAFNGPMCPW